MKKIQWAFFEKLQFQIFYLIKQGQQQEVKLLRVVPFILMESKYKQYNSILYSRCKKKNAISFKICLLIWPGEKKGIKSWFYSKNQISTLLVSESRHFLKLTAFFFLKPLWRIELYCLYLDSIKMKGTSLSNSNSCCRPCFIR